MQVEQIDADRELFIILSNADGQMAERILCAIGWTHAIQAFARHRIAERKRVVGEIVAWLRKDDFILTADELEAKFGETGND